MRPDNSLPRVYLHRDPVDFRKAVDGLAAIVDQSMGLEQHRFHWPRHLEGDITTLTGQQLNWLLDGYNIKYLEPHPRLHYRSTV